MRNALILLSSLVLLGVPALAAPSTDSAELTAPRKKRPKKTNYINTKLNKGTVGLQLGLSFSSLYYDGNSADAKFGSGHTGGSAGAAYDKAISKVLSYSAGGRYHSKGGSDSDNSIVFDYIEVPAMLKLRFPVNRKVMPYVGIGLFAAMAFQSEAKINGNKNKEARDQWNSLDGGLLFGVGSFFTLTKQLMASAELSYAYGLMDLIDHGNWKVMTDSDEIFSRDLIFSAAIHF